MRPRQTVQAAGCSSAANRRQRVARCRGGGVRRGCDARSDAGRLAAEADTDVRLLGPVEVSVDGRRVRLGGSKARALVAILALNAAKPVSADRPIEGLWGEQPPATLRAYVSRLQRAFEASGDGSTIVTRPNGYELRVEPDEVDAMRFERPVARGAPRRALTLSRGRALDDGRAVRRRRDPPARRAAADGDRAGDRHR